MDTETAEPLLNSWHEDGGEWAHHDRFQRVLQTLVPDDGEAAGVVVLDDVPTVLTVHREVLLTVHVLAEGERGKVVVRHFPLVRGQVSIEVVDDRSGEAKDGGPAHVRDWSFTWADGRQLAFRTVAGRGGWRPGPDSGEAVAQSIAAGLGWSLPKPTR